MKTIMSIIFVIRIFMKFLINMIFIIKIVFIRIVIEIVIEIIFMIFEIFMIEMIFKILFSSSNRVRSKIIFCIIVATKFFFFTFDILSISKIFDLNFDLNLFKKNLFDKFSITRACDFSIVLNKFWTSWFFDQIFIQFSFNAYKKKIDDSQNSLLNSKKKLNFE